MSWIQTHTGKAFDFKNPRPQDICIEDIAHALSHICRFAGHVKNFYSVAEHSWFVSMQVPPQDALAGLLHDATEAYLVDVPKPLKDLLPEYSHYETLAWTAVAYRFNLPIRLPESVKTADCQMLLAERDALIGAPIHPWEMDQRFKAPNVSPVCWSPKVARQMFLDRFRQLVN
jgi:uncharacterized protein